MARRSPVRRGLPSVVVAILVVALTVSVGGLVVLALQRGQGTATDRIAEPVPSLGPDSPTATPTPSPTPLAIAAPGAAERFLAADPGRIWRATAGSCGDTAPVIERSDDDGATWTDVTPVYRDIAQVRDLLPFSDTQATLIADVGEECETQALRTFTDGEFWSPYDNVLAASAYPTGDTLVIDGVTLDAPCAEPWGLRSSGGTVAVVCDGVAYATTDGQTTRLGDGVVALDILDGDIVAATVAPDCDGLQLTVLPTGDAIDCVAADAASPSALALTADTVWLWNSTALTSTPR